MGTPCKKIGQVEISTPNGKVNNVDISEVIDENLELKKRVARLEQEKAILKKAGSPRFCVGKIF